MKNLTLLVALLVSQLSLSDSRICVRNFASQGLDFCQSFPTAYTYAVAESTELEKICTRKYARFYCDTSESYELVLSTANEEICVMNYNQPPVANFCESLPQYYNYIRERP